MDADGDIEAGFEIGRRRTSPSSSRESSPAAKRQERSFTPTSDDGNVVIPAAHNEDTATPTPENAPLIRQAVGFSSVSANVNTYQATVAPGPVVPYFLPGQAPPPPPKQKQRQTKPRAPRKKKGEQFCSQTTKFKISGSASSPDSGFASLGTTSPGNSADTSPSSGAARSTAAPSSMIPVTSYFGSSNGNATADPSNTNGTATSVASNVLPSSVKRTRKRKAPVSSGVSFSQSSILSPPRLPVTAPIATSVAPQCPPNVNPRGSPVENPVRQRSYSASPVGPGGAPAGLTNSSTTVARGTAQKVSKPLRMVTLLIEDMRSGAPDPQLAEVSVPLKVADDPEDGFWADAVEICNALQSPAKVYTMRGRFRQFFMRVDQFDEFQVQSAHLGVSKERTLNVFVEAPMLQGQLPRPPPSDVRPGRSSSPEREATAACADTYCRSAYSLVTREDQVERLSKSNYVVAQSRRFSPASESGSYGHSQRTTSPQRLSRHDNYSGPSRILTPPIPGRYADTEEEKDEAIADYIRSHIENHPGWMEYMQSKAKPQRISEVLGQYAFVEDRVRELIGLKTPAHWDGAPSSYVERHHVWRVLKLDSTWGEECRETSLLVGFYGKNGSRYEDSRVVDMIEDTLPPRTNTMDKFLRLLRNIDGSFTEDALRGPFASTST